MVLIGLPRKTAISRRKNRSEDPADLVATLLEPTSPAAESYRALRTNLLYAMAGAASSAIAVTSPGDGEGKSVTCANLGMVLAQAEKTTLVADCNLRRPALHEFFGLRKSPGMSDMLAGACTLRRALQEPLPRLNVLPGGLIPSNPTELLSSKRFSNFLSHVREEFDCVLLDTPAVGPMPDTAVLAGQVDGVLLVLDAQKVNRGGVKAAHSLEAVGANVLGTVLNRRKRSGVSLWSYAR